MSIDYSEWMNGSKELLVTAHVFAQKSQHNNLTSALVLSFALEKYQKDLRHCIKDFFIFKHRILKEAIAPQKNTPAQDNFEDSLTIAIHKSLPTCSLNEFLKHLVILKGGIIIKKINLVNI